MGSLIGLIKEGQKIAAGAFGGKAVKGFRERCGAWSQKVEEELQDDAFARARFESAQPILHEQAGIPFGVAAHWQRLKGQLAVLIELEKERPKAVTFKPGAYGIHANPQVIWRNLKAWISKR
jgi:hypothetical protein